MEWLRLRTGSRVAGLFGDHAIAAEVAHSKASRAWADLTVEIERLAKWRTGPPPSCVGLWTRAAAAINVLDQGKMESVGQIQDFFLVRQVQGGNQAAFEQLVHVHDQAVLRLAFRITGSQSDAQDIYQEAFLKIYRMVTNLCLDHLRKTRSRRQSSATEVSKEGEEYDLLNQISDDRPAHNPEQQLWRLSEHLSCALQTPAPP